MILFFCHCHILSSAHVHRPDVKPAVLEVKFLAQWNLVALHNIGSYFTSTRCRVEDGVKQEPLEELMCEVEDAYSGPVIEAVTLRKGSVCSPPSSLFLPFPSLLSTHTVISTVNQPQNQLMQNAIH